MLQFKNLQLPNNWDLRLADPHSYRFEEIAPRVPSAALSYKVQCTLSGYEYFNNVWDANIVDIQRMGDGDSERWKNYCRSAFYETLNEFFEPLLKRREQEERRIILPRGYN